MQFRASAMIALGGIAGLGIHSLYKQAYAINSWLRFEHYGMGERTIWQAALLAAAYAASRFLPDIAKRPAALSLALVALLHFVWFTLILHNPLLSVQLVGPTPIANWLTLAFATAVAALWFVQEQWEGRPASADTLFDAAKMVLIALCGYALLRQIFAGSILTSRAIGQNESLWISLLGIVLALGFLWWGSFRILQSWRIGSLVLMLIAVVKVFLIDAAALEGLLRIASFMALGFSLIGIGWFYSRQLKRLEVETT